MIRTDKKTFCHQRYVKILPCILGSQDFLSQNKKKAKRQIESCDNRNINKG